MWEVQGIFIISKSCHFARVECLKSHFLLIIIIKDKCLLHNIKRRTNISCTILLGGKYLLQNINGDENMISF